ncbi:MAG: hypothetical protein JAY74_22155 [Candidatus Thiodiazotropha taylori]|nr:hypothetical protein [Candidatus Thiodiazotropha taylori]
MTTIAVFYESQAIGSAEMSRLELIGSKAKIMFLRLKFNKNGVSGLSESNKVESWNSATVPITQYQVAPHGTRLDVDKEWGVVALCNINCGVGNNSAFVCVGETCRTQVLILLRP